MPTYAAAPTPAVMVVWDADTLSYVAWQGSLEAASVTIGAVTVNKTALTPAAPTFATVGVASGEAVASNSNRKGLILVNTSANRISIAFGANPAVLDRGITLYANGGTYCTDEFSHATQAVNAIASAGSSNLAVQEYS